MASTPNTSPPIIAPSTVSSWDGGSVGDVIVPDMSWFSTVPDSNGVPTTTGYTFFIIGNPYGDDAIIFQAVGIDDTLGPRQFKIWIPGGADNSTPIAQAWNAAGNWHDIVIQSSSDTSHIQSVVAPSPFPSVVQIAQGELAKKPSSVSNSDGGGPIDAYNSYANAKQGSDWGMSFVSWAADQVGLLSNNGLTPTSNTQEFIDSVSANHPEWFITDGPIMPGDIVIYDKSSDAGIVESVQRGSFTVIKGNA